MKKKNTYQMIGLMSGTSLDGLDIVHVHFYKENEAWTFEIGKNQSVQYNPPMKEKFKNITHTTALDLLLFHNEYGRWLGQKVKHFIETNRLKIDWVASHGHTAFHQPDKKITYQIGNGQEIANGCNHKVICDFRSLDVSIGGQGAPLVPIGDRLLFGKYDFCLNLGGIANVSFEKLGKRIAFDITPANMILNHLAQKLGYDYDPQGKIAEKGTFNQLLFKQMNNLPFYSETPPKSLGFEWFSKNMLPILEHSHISLADQLCTTVHHITFQIAQHLMPHITKNNQIFTTGGGAKNHFLISTLSQKIEKQAKIILPNNNLIDFKEAIVFAFIGLLRTREEINCLASVTGANRDTSSGYLFYPHNNS